MGKVLHPIARFGLSAGTVIGTINATIVCVEAEKFISSAFFLYVLGWAGLGLLAGEICSACKDALDFIDPDK